MRFRPYTTRAVGLLAATAALLPSASAGKVDRLRFEPVPIFLEGPGSSQRFIITGIATAGIETDLTTSCRVTPLDEAIAWVKDGKVVGRAQGQNGNLDRLRRGNVRG